MQSEDVYFTSSEELDSFQPGDNSVVITAALVRLDPQHRRAGAPEPRIRVLRGILNNFDGRELRVLIWQERVAEFEHRILGQILRIRRPRVVLANPTYADPLQNLMAIELSIQSTTVIEILGPIPPQQNPAGPVYHDVAIREVGNMLGPVVVTAFIRYRIERQVIANFNYGNGAVTDGTYHLCCNVTAFDDAQSPPPGTHVRLQGELRRNNFNTLILQVADMRGIQIIDDQRMSDAELRNGFRVPPRNEPQVANQQQNVQQQPLAQVAQHPAAPLNVQQQVPALAQVAQHPAASLNVQQQVPAQLVYQQPLAQVAQHPAAPLNVQQQVPALAQVAQHPAASLNVQQQVPAQLVHQNSLAQVAQHPSAPLNVQQQVPALAQVAQHPAAPLNKQQQVPAQLVYQQPLAQVAQHPAAPPNVQQQVPALAQVAQHPAAPPNVQQQTVEPAQPSTSRIRNRALVEGPSIVIEDSDESDQDTKARRGKKCRYDSSDSSTDSGGQESDDKGSDSE